MLHHRKQLQVSVAHVPGVGNQLLSQLAVGEEGIVRVRRCLLLLPGPQMHLVDVHGRGGLPIFLGGAPAAVPPMVAVQRHNPGGGAGADFVGEPKGVGFIQNLTVPGGDAVFVELALCCRDNAGVDPGGTLGGEWGPLPAVEVADDGDGSHLGTPDCESDTAGHRMGTKEPIAVIVGPLVEQVELFLGQSRISYTHNGPFRGASPCCIIP